MSLEQYQRNVNRLDEEIAKLEKRKAESDAKAAKERELAARSTASIRKNDSPSRVASKTKDATKHNEAATKADANSAKLQKQIASTRDKRNHAVEVLQREQRNQTKREQQSRAAIQRTYENRIQELESKALLSTSMSVEVENSPSATYDVFISHASEDKASFVDELVTELEKLGVRVWYDTSAISWGDSLRSSIDEGLRKSRFGIIVLSPAYIAEGSD